MAIPPPPGPPRPPPPPATSGLKLCSGSSGEGGGIPATDARSALLQSIQKGTKLKKTVTNDKSGPLTTGKIIGESKSSSPSKRINNSSVNNSSSSSSNSSKVSSVSQQQHIANGGPKLAGLFEGMTSMPKLKPVNSKDNVPSTRAASGIVAQENKVVVNNITNSNNNNRPMDFNTELTKHLTFKRQKQQQQLQHQTINATEANLRTNRGPPPKPPVQKNMSSSASDSVLEKSNSTTSSSSLKSNSTGGKASSPTLSEGINSTSNNLSTKKYPSLSLSIENSNINSDSSSSSILTIKSSTMNTPSLSHQNIVPNKSTLFGTSNNSNIINNSSSSSVNSENHNNHSLSSTQSLMSCSKSIPNHGKPNCAPKPPGIHQLLSNGEKPTVSRHHSMKSPRSPSISIATGGGSLFSTAQYFGTLRGPPQHFNQSQESIATTIMRQAPNPPLGRPTEAPPKPPSIKPAPPPIPARSVSNTNLTSLPLSTATAAGSSGNSNTNLNTSLFGSTNNVSSVSAIKEQLKNQISYTGSGSNVSIMKSSNQLSNTIISPSALTPSTSGSFGTNNFGSNYIGGSTAKLNSPIHHHNSNNTTSSRDQFKKGSNLNGLSPPVPSHRIHPAPDPPQRQILSNQSSLIPPKPPERHSSIRSNSTVQATTTTNLGKKGYNSQISGGSGNISHNSRNQITAATINNTVNTIGIVNRLVVDIEMKFGSKFHNVTEFPTPPPFLSTPKIYPSRNINNAENRKPRAPSPPSHRHQQQKQQALQS